MRYYRAINYFILIINKGVICPKKIELTKEMLIDITEKLILEKKYNEISARNIANIASCSVGSIYKYIKTKGELLALVIMRDWKDALNNIETNFSLEEGLKNIYMGVFNFTNKYIDLWINEKNNLTTYNEYVKRHREFIIDIENKLKEVVTYNNIPYGDGNKRMIFVAENIYFFATKLTDYSQVNRILEEIIKYKEEY